MNQQHMGSRTLDTIAAGHKGRVLSLLGGREFYERLTSMGINIGCEIEVLHSSLGQNGPALVLVGETRLAVGQGMAARILIALDRPEPQPKSWFGRPSGRTWFRSCCRRAQTFMSWDKWQHRQEQDNHCML